MEITTFVKTLPSDKFEGEFPLSYFYAEVGKEYVCKENFELEIFDGSEWIVKGDIIKLDRKSGKCMYYSLQEAS